MASDSSTVWPHYLETRNKWFLLGPAPLNSLVNDLEKVLQHTLLRSGDKTTPEDRVASKRDLGVEEQAKNHLMKLKKDKMQSPAQGKE